MQKDIQQSKGETQKKFDQPKQEATSKEGHKLKQVGHDINANLKENVGVGFGNYPSGVDREKSQHHEQRYDEKKEKEEFKRKQEKIEKEDESGAFSHKVQELGHNINANLKQNVGIGLGNYSSEVDREKANEHREKYEEKIDNDKEKIEEKKEETKEKLQSGETGIYSHRIQEVGHTINANLKENIGIGLGDYPSEVDRQKATEHRELYEEKVKEESKPEVSDSTSLGHKIKEVAHTVNANLKEMIGIGVGNYSSEVDRELASIHKEKYEEKVQQQGKVEEFSTKEGESFSTKEGESFSTKEGESFSNDEKCLHNDDKCTHREKLQSKEGKIEESKQKSGSGENKL